MKTFKPTRVFVPSSGPAAKPPPRKKRTADAPEPAARVSAASPAAVPTPAPPVPPPPPAPPAVVRNAAPPGHDYVLEIERAQRVESRKLGPTIEVRFGVVSGPHQGCVARGQFPLSGRGLPILSASALGESIDFSAAETAQRLVGKSVLADVTNTENVQDQLAIVRNIRPHGAA